MADDGSHEVAWKGQAFHYLLHREGLGSNDSYGHHRQAAASSHGHNEERAAPSARAAGVWDGPAPRGYAGTATAQAGAAASSRALEQPDVDTVLLGNGRRMPLLGLGTGSLTSADSIRSALELGYRFFDCAAFYDNEPLVGEGLRDFLAAGKRDELFITSKVWNTHHRPAAVRASCLQSLSDLGCHYLDLYLIHWPHAWLPEAKVSDANPAVDTEVTLQETWSAMEALVDEGLVRSIGVSNFNLADVEALLSGCRIRPVVNQIEMHPLLAQRKMVGVCYRKGVQCMAYSPLGSPGYDRPNTLKNQPAVLQVAKETGKTVEQVLLRWNVQRGIPVIPRSASREHQAKNIEGLFTWRLSNEHKALLDAMDSHTRFVEPVWHKFADPEQGGAVKPSLTLA